MDSKKVRQYVLMGAGVGLYFGYFFRPTVEPSIVTIVGLSILITIIMTSLQFYRGERENMLMKAGVTFLQYGALLAVLTARHYAFDFGGRPAVIVMTTVMGALSGYWMVYKENNQIG